MSTNKLLRNGRLQMQRMLCAMGLALGYVIAGGLLIGISGCEKSPTVKTISLTPITFAEWDKQLASYQPKIVVVDAWAMWCSPCIKRFPHMVEMSKQYANRGVSFVSLNLDEYQDSDARTRANAFLTELQADFDHFQVNENLLDAFDHFDLIGIPAVLIYDGSGKERFRLTGDNPNAQFTEQDIEQAVQELLAEG